MLIVITVVSALVMSSVGHGASEGRVGLWVLSKEKASLVLRPKNRPASPSVVQFVLVS